MNEFELIRRFFNRPVHDATVRLGIGDDAAAIMPSPGCELLLSIDTLVEGRHFFPDVPPATLGHKVLAVNLSDMAAMGATPRWALLSGTLPDSDASWLAAFSEGLFALADRHGVSLIGGDTVRGPRSFTLTIIGETPTGSALTRRGAHAGDDLWVSGPLGGAALALAAMQQRLPPDLALTANDFAALRQRLETPEPRVALGQALRGIASAALDISDGLTGDLMHLLTASRLDGHIILDSIPRPHALQRLLDSRDAATQALGRQCLLAGGDDYELCFAAPPDARATVATIARQLNLPLTRIGHTTPAVPSSTPQLTVLDKSGVPLPDLPAAFNHFL